MADVKGSGLPLDSSLDDTHYISVTDPTGTTPVTKRTLLSTLRAWLQATTNWVTAAMLDVGMVVQVVETDFSNLISQTGTIPYDNTLPQNTEGFEVMTQAITPKNANNYLLVEAEIYGSLNGGVGELSAALFRDSAANAVAGDSVTVPNNGYLANVRLRYKVLAGSTSATTFRVRIGAAGGQNVAFNGFANAGAGSGNQVFSTAAKSTMKITEVKA